MGTLLSLVAGVNQNLMLRKRSIPSLHLRANMLGFLIFYYCGEAVRILLRSQFRVRLKKVSS